MEHTINTILSYAVGAGCLLFWVAAAIGTIWNSSETKKKSDLRPGHYINSALREDGEETDD